MTPANVLRFWSRLEHRKTGCWEWTGSRNRDGYGSLTVEGRSHGAHRVAWSLANGEIPAGLMVCHSCDNPPCCNPDHLWLGTSADNQRDAAAKGRSRTGRQIGPRRPFKFPNRTGELNPIAKLDAERVAQIRSRFSAGEASQRALAREYGVSHTVVRRIVNRVAWEHVA